MREETKKINNGLLEKMEKTKKRERVVEFQFV